MAIPGQLQDLITVALIIDAFIFGAMWQFMSGSKRGIAAKKQDDVVKNRNSNINAR
jgi:hypothetical protein